VASVCRSAHYHLWQIRPTLQSSSHDSAKTLVQAYISSRPDYYNSLLYGVTDNLFQRLRSVQNAAARLITRTGHLFCRNSTGCLSDAVSTSNWQHWCSSHYTAVHRRTSQMRASRCLRPVAVSARLVPSHASYRGPELVWATGRLFDVAAPQLWNKLPASLQSSESLCQFRRHSWKRFCLARTELRRLVTLAFRCRI